MRCNCCDAGCLLHKPMDATYQLEKYRQRQAFKEFMKRLELWMGTPEGQEALERAKATWQRLKDTNADE